MANYNNKELYHKASPKMKKISPKTLTLNRIFSQDIIIKLH